MGWNDIRIVTVPPGTTVRIELDPRFKNAAGEPVEMVDFIPPASELYQGPNQSVVLDWLSKEGFRLVHPKLLEYVRDDVTIVIHCERIIVTQITFKFLIELNAREKLAGWQGLVIKACRRFGFAIVDVNSRQVGEDLFIRAFMGSFGWECFLKREEYFKSKAR